MLIIASVTSCRGRRHEESARPSIIIVFAKLPRQPLLRAYWVLVVWSVRKFASCRRPHQKAYSVIPRRPRRRMHIGKHVDCYHRNGAAGTSRRIRSIHHNKLPKGGHFAAWEQPKLFAEEIRAGFRSLRR